MRNISIKKLNDRHYVVYINDECVYEGIDRGSCLKYLRGEKRKFLRESSKKEALTRSQELEETFLIPTRKGLRLVRKPFKTFVLNE